MNKKGLNTVLKATILMLSTLVLVSCKKEEPIIEPEPEPVEEIDMEDYRVDGDRVEVEPVLDSEARRRRLVDQYETIDRPIIMNTLRYIIEFDIGHEDAFEGVRLITDKSIDKLKDEKLVEYKEHLGEPLSKETTQIYDIDKVYPYTKDDYSSYYETVVNIIQDNVLERTQTYGKIKQGIEERDFDYIKSSGIIRNYKEVIDAEGKLYEQVRPYVEELDTLIALERQEMGMEPPKYTTIESDIEPVAEYRVPKKATVQEIMKAEPKMDLYIDGDNDEGKEEGKDEGKKEDEEEDSKGEIDK